MSEILSGLLIGKEEIRDFLRGASDYKLKKWIGQRSKGHVSDYNF
jgi:hypothetical protein